MTSTLTLNAATKTVPQNASGATGITRNPKVFEHEHVRPIVVFARRLNGLGKHLETITSELRSGDAAKEAEAINTFYRDVVLRLRFADLTPEQVSLFIATLYEEQISLSLKLEVLYSLRLDYAQMLMGCKEVIRDLAKIAVDQGLNPELRYEALYTLLDIYITENRFRSNDASRNELFALENLAEVFRTLSGQGRLADAIADFETSIRKIDNAHKMRPDFMLMLLYDVLCKIASGEASRPVQRELQVAAAGLKAEHSI